MLFPPRTSKQSNQHSADPTTSALLRVSCGNMCRSTKGEPFLNARVAKKASNIYLFLHNANRFSVII